MLTVSELRKTYPGNQEETLRGINIQFEDNGLYYILGSSGCGKSTFLSLIGGMDYDYRGSIRYEGKELSGMNEKEMSDYRLNHIAFAFQDNKSNDRETVEDCILKALSIEEVSLPEKKRRMDHYLKELGLLEKKKVRMETLSGGERKRIALIRALVKQSDILLCDEPLSSLNKELREKTTFLLKEESKTRTVIIITHEKEEIDPDSYIYQMEEGKLFLRQEGIHYPKTKKKKQGRIPYQGMIFLKDLLKGIQRKSEFLVITLLSLAIALFAVSFSFLLSHGVKASLSVSLKSYMDTNCMVIESKESAFESDSYKTADYHFLSLIQRNYPEEVIGISDFYLENLDDIFKGDQRFSISFENRTIAVHKISSNSFLEYRTVEELSKDEEIYGKKENLGYDEIILGVDLDSVASLYYLIFNATIPSVTDEVMEKLSKAVQRIRLGLRIQLGQNEWHYTLDHIISIVGIAFTNRSCIIHSENDFQEQFLKGILHFKDYYEDEEEKERTPIEIPKCTGLRIRPGKLGSFLSHFLFDEAANSYTLRPMTNQSYYRKEEKNTHNRFAVYKDYLSKINPNEILSFVRENQDRVQSVSYSTPVFTFTASGYISGFTKPFFFSKRKEKLNEIQDSYQETSLNLGQFQGSLIQVPKGVIKADLLSSSEKEGIRFRSLDQSDCLPFLGKSPQETDEIGISSKMAQYLFGSDKEALDQPLQVLMLKETEKKEGKYENIFDEGSLKITGIYQDEENCIYQDSLFPLCYAFSNSTLRSDEIKITEAVLKVDIENTPTEYYEKEIRKFGDYKVSFPMLSMMEEIRSTMNSLSSLFLFFAILSLFLSSSLLGLSMYLILERDKKEIGILLSLGYYKKEISKYYIFFSLFVGFIGYLISFILTFLGERVLQKTLTDMLSVYEYSYKPYLISFLVYFILSLSIGLLLSFRIQRFSPKDAFQEK